MDMRKLWKRFKRHVHHTYLRMRGRRDELEELLNIEIRNKRDLASVYKYILEKSKGRDRR